jgi:signal transduction histidine kinase
MAEKPSSRTSSQASSKEMAGHGRALRRRGSEVARLEALANLAHELRTPLQVLLGYLEILRDEWGDGFESEPREMLERMNVSLHELSHTVDNVMEFVLAEAGGMVWVQEEVSVTSLVNDLAPAIDAARSGKALALKFDLNDAPQTIHVPRRPLRSILSNLVLNAIKFTERGTVTVRICRMRERGAERGVEIEVTDTGMGISPGLIKLAAEPFAQLSNSNSRKHRGLGLGLAVVHRNAQVLGARLKISSAPGRGSRFVVRIPAARIAPSHASGTGERTARGTHQCGAAIASPPRRATAAEAVAPVAFA